VTWPLDVASASGRGWSVLHDDDVRSDDGVHRLLRTDGAWRAYRSLPGAPDPEDLAAWEAMEFRHSGTLAGALDDFDLGGGLRATA
jgi:hypothetical protein